MRFEANNGDSVEISVVGWAQETEDWLTIEVRGVDATGEWVGVDPSLRLSEALELAEWLVNPGSFENSRLGFLEPELAFQYRAGDLHVCLEWKLRPPWRPTNPDVDEPYCLGFEVALPEIETQSRHWKAVLDRLRLQRQGA